MEADPADTGRTSGRLQRAVLEAARVEVAARCRREHERRADPAPVSRVTATLRFLHEAPDNLSMRERLEQFCFAESLGLVIWVVIVPLLLIVKIAHRLGGGDSDSGCGGDGGVPWAARPSPLGHFCTRLNDGGLDTWLVYPVPLLVAASGFLLIYVPRRGWRPTTLKVTTIVIGLALVIASFMPPTTVIYRMLTLSPVCGRDTSWYTPIPGRTIAGDCHDHMAGPH
jgi:hypothetical protein